MNIRKLLAQSPLGTYLARYPLKFAKPAFFGPRPVNGQQVTIKNGTVTLVDLGQGPIGVTCHHVIQQFRSDKAANNSVIFQISSTELDPIAQLIDENDALDIATFSLTPAQIRSITATGPIGSKIYRPRQWPPFQPREGESMSFGGFPGAARTVLNWDQIIFGSWSNGGTPISSVTQGTFTCAFDREYWVRNFGEREGMELRALGGMSGGPAFVRRGLRFELVGIVCQYSGLFDAVSCASILHVHADGHIQYVE